MGKKISGINNFEYFKLACLPVVTAVIFSITIGGVANAQQGDFEEESDTFVPLVSGFELPEEEEEIVNMPSPEEEISLEKFKDDYADLKEIINKRLGDLSVESTFDQDGSFEGLPSVDTSKYSNDLEQFAAIKREIDLLALRVEQAKLAQELWVTLFGEEEEESSNTSDSTSGMTENEIMMMEQLDAMESTIQEEGTSTQPEEPSGPTAMMTTSNGWTLFTDENQVYFAKEAEGGTPDMSTIRSVEDIMIERADEAINDMREQLEQESIEAEQERNREIARLPSVVSITGVGENLRARLHDSRAGIIEVSAGDVLPGGNTVRKVTTYGVEFSTPGGQIHHVGVGASGMSEMQSEF